MTRDIVIVTGLSGAGLSSALKVLEDSGYEVIDNFPLVYIDTLMQETSDDSRPLALGVDTRTRGFSPTRLVKVAREHKARLVFLNADDSALQKRFSETRRRHPLARDKPVSAGISRERHLLQPVENNADEIIDTTSLSIHDLRRVLEASYAPEKKDSLTLTLISFGFRNGLPREADIVMDVRFLRNPNWEPDLKSLTGQNKKVGDYIREDTDFAPFLEHFKTLIAPLLPRYKTEGKQYLTIAIGCTGGRHRSVYIVEQLKGWLDNKKYSCHVIHRDLPLEEIRKFSGHEDS